MTLTCDFPAKALLPPARVRTPSNGPFSPSDLLCPFQERRGLTNEQAALALGISLATLKRMRSGAPIGRATQSIVLRNMGYRTLDEATQDLIPETHMVKAHNSLAAEWEDVVLRDMQRATVLRETRLMLSAYPAPRLRYRHRLAAELTKRIKSASIRVMRVEQFRSIDRLVDVLLNIHDFPISCYEIRVIRAGEVIPYPNFTLIDEHGVICGGIIDHVHSEEESFLEFTGSEYCRFYMQIWGRLWNDTAVDFSAAADLDALALALAREIPGYSEFSADELQTLLQERRETAKQYPPMP